MSSHSIVTLAASTNLDQTLKSDINVAEDKKMKTYSLTDILYLLV